MRIRHLQIRETDWQASVDKAYAVMDDWREKLDDIDDDKLNSPVNDPI
jgi:hypothetical protein